MKRLKGVQTWIVRAHVNPASWAFGPDSYGSTKRPRGVPTWVARTYVDPAIAPYGATGRVR
eukprot:9018844-Pyramimonas_sp.AAC.1